LLHTSMTHNAVELRAMGASLIWQRTDARGGGPGNCCRASKGGGPGRKPASAAAAVSGSCSISLLNCVAVFAGAERPLNGSGTLKRLHSSGSGRHSWLVRTGRFTGPGCKATHVTAAARYSCRWAVHTRSARLLWSCPYISS